MSNLKFSLNSEIDGVNIINKKTVLIGIGGGGQNIVNYIYDKNYADIKILSVNSDEQALKLSKTKNILLYGNQNIFWHIKKIFNKKLHLGCGGNTEIAKSYTLACEKVIKKEIKKADKVVLVSCFGGGTGTGATPVFAKFAHDLGIDVEATVVHPVKFEGLKREKRTLEGICELKKYTKKVKEIYNNELIEANSKNSLSNAFLEANEKIIRVIFENLN